MNKHLKSYRVSGEEKDSFYLMDSGGQIFRAELKGKLRFESDFWPAVGDYVLGSFQPGDWVLIEEVLGRRNALKRKDPNGQKIQIFASNVDFAFIVTSANDDLNEKRLDRYVAMALDCDTTPIIVINKIELVSNPQFIVESLQKRFSSIAIEAVSVLAEINLGVFDNYLTVGRTGAFIGSSGVGKSSLVNFLLGFEANSTQEIREDDAKGRHTTTRRSLHLLASGGAIIDTPGIRSLALVDGAEGVSELFSDISRLAEMCKFRDCRHQGEPGCAVLEAMSSDEIDESRWQSFQKLQRENEFESSKSDKRMQKDKKRKIAKAMRQYKQIKQEKQRR